MTSSSNKPQINNKKTNNAQTVNKKEKKHNQNFSDMHNKLQELIQDIEDGKIVKAKIKDFAKNYPLALNIADQKTGETLLHRLLRANVKDVDLYKALLASGASPCIPDRNKFTAAHLAADYNFDPDCVIFPLLIADCNLSPFDWVKYPRSDMNIWQIAIYGSDSRGGNPKAIAAMCKYGAIVPGDIDSAFGVAIHEKYPRAEETVRAFLENFDKKKNWDSRRAIKPGHTVVYDDQMMNLEEPAWDRPYFYNTRELSKNGSITTLYNYGLLHKLEKSPITRRPWRGSGDRYIQEYDPMEYSELMRRIETIVNPPPPFW